MAATTTTTTTETTEVQTGGNLYLTSEQQDNAILAQPAQSEPAPPSYDEKNAAVGSQTTAAPAAAPNAAPAAASATTPYRQPVTLHELGLMPGYTKCPLCEHVGITRVEKHAGDHAMKMGLIACLCLGICCAWLPCVIDDCKDSEHYCTNCGYKLVDYPKGAASPTIIMTAGKVQSIQQQRQLQQQQQLKQQQQQQQANAAAAAPQAEVTNEKPVASA